MQGSSNFALILASLGSIVLLIKTLALGGKWWIERKDRRREAEQRELDERPAIKVRSLEEAIQFLESQVTNLREQLRQRDEDADARQVALRQTIRDLSDAQDMERKNRDEVNRLELENAQLKRRLEERK